MQSQEFFKKLKHSRDGNAQIMISSSFIPTLHYINGHIGKDELQSHAGLEHIVIVHNDFCPFIL